MKSNRCVHCGSSDYGKGCRFAPHGVHVHSEDSTKCSYCGSKDYGKGCRLNPTSNLHVRGGIYNNMYKESVQSILDERILLKLLKKEITEFECYKLGVIDSQGNKIKNNLNEQEERSYDSLTKTILRIKKFLGPKADLLHAVNSFQTQISESKVNKEQYTKLLEHQNKIDNIINELYQAIELAQMDGIGINDIKNLIKA